MQNNFRNLLLARIMSDSSGEWAPENLMIKSYDENTKISSKMVWPERPKDPQAQTQRCLNKLRQPLLHFLNRLRNRLLSQSSPIPLLPCSWLSGQAHFNRKIEMFVCTYTFKLMEIRVDRIILPTLVRQHMITLKTILTEILHHCSISEVHVSNKGRLRLNVFTSIMLSS